MTEPFAVTPLRDRDSSRDRVRSHRFRRKYGLVRRQLLISQAQLDALEEGGYLDPTQRGSAVDEVEALQTFVSDYLGA